MKLISNTEWGNYCKLKESSFSNRIEYLEWYFSVRSRIDDFLNQQPKLGMFVPCDEDGNVLEEPSSIGVGNDFYLERAIDQYQQAKERVLFEGFEIPKEGIALDRFKQWLELKRNVESLVGIGHLELTPQALKQIGL